MSFSIPSSCRKPLLNPYKAHASASRSKSASKFKTQDGDTVDISTEAYTLLETNITGIQKNSGPKNRHTDRN